MNVGYLIGTRHGGNRAKGAVTGASEAGEIGTNPDGRFRWHRADGGFLLRQNKRILDGGIEIFESVGKRRGADAAAHRDREKNGEANREKAGARLRRQDRFGSLSHVSLPKTRI
jgi:hypothetical protein